MMDATMYLHQQAAHPQRRAKHEAVADARERGYGGACEEVGCHDGAERLDDGAWGHVGGVCIAEPRRKIVGLYFASAQHGDVIHCVLGW